MIPLRISINGTAIDIYQVTDESKKTVKYIGYSNLKDLSSFIQLICIDPKNKFQFSDELAEWAAYVESTDWSKSKKYTASSTRGFFENLASSMVSSGSPYIMSEPSLFGGNGAYRLFALDEIGKGNISSWDEFLSRLDYPDLFCSWVWTIFANVRCRQALWLQGEGLDGKSVITNTISDYLGHLAISLDSDAVSRGNRFGLQDISGKRLIVFADNKNPNIIQTERMQRLLGGDNITVEKRNIGSVSVPNRFRTIITSNITPELSSQMNDQTRILRIKVIKSPSFAGNGKPWSERLKDELPAFLAHCRDRFQASGYMEDRAGFELPLDQEIVTSHLQDLIDSFISTALVDDEKSIATAKDVSRDFIRYCQSYEEKVDKPAISQLIRTIKQHGHEQKPHRVGNSVVKGYKGLKLAQLYTSPVFIAQGVN